MMYHVIYWTTVNIFLAFMFPVPKYSLFTGAYNPITGQNYDGSPSQQVRLCVKVEIDWTQVKLLGFMAQSLFFVFVF